MTSSPAFLPAFSRLLTRHEAMPQYIHNCENAAPIRRARFNSTIPAKLAFSDAFTWRETREGFCYWTGIHRNWIGLIHSRNWEDDPTSMSQLLEYLQGSHGRLITTERI